MNHSRIAAGLVVLATAGLVCAGCSGGGGSGGATAVAAVSSSPAPSPSASPSPSVSPSPSPTAAPLPSPSPSPSPTPSRGWDWVRREPMFISGLTVMPPPDPAHVDAYFDDFKANAVHLWQWGMGPRMDGWRAANRPDFRFVSWLEADGTSGANQLLLGGYPANEPGRIGFQISDEPREMSELRAIEVGVNAVRAADPDALIIVNFSHYANDLNTQLAYYGSQIQGDIVSYDDYRRKRKVYEWLEVFREAGLRYGMPYWRYLNSYKDGGPGNESNMRWEAFAGLVYGYTGHTWFVYQVAGNSLGSTFFDQPSDFDAVRTRWYGVAAQINTEMAHLGRAITQFRSTGVCYIPAVALLQPPRTRNWSPGAGGDPYVAGIYPDGFRDLSVGFFQDDAGSHYVMVQNVNHEGASWPADSESPQTVEVVFDFSGSQDPSLDPNFVQVLDQTTGQVRDVPLVARSGGRSALRVTLAAGDPILFKYKTSRSFTLQ